MATPTRNAKVAPEVRESIEAKGSDRSDDEDVDMEDAGAETGAAAAATAAGGDAADVAVEEAMDVDVEAEAEAEVGDDADADADADGEAEQQTARSEETRTLLGLIDSTLTHLTSYRDNGRDLSEGFQRIPNRRMLPDYFEIIHEPTAFSTVRGKLLKKQYTAFPEFVRDVALICHNAQVYNRPSAPIFKRAVRLTEVFKEKLQALVKDGTIEDSDAQLPDLGDLPEIEDSPPAEPEEEEADADEDEEEDEDEEDEEEDSDEEGGRPRRKAQRGGRPSIGKKEKDEEGKEDDPHKKRGRPPKVFTPMEARIHAFLKGLRKPKNDKGELLIVPFEKLPDKTAHPEYYHAIKTPMVLDLIKKKAKRKKYQNVDQALADVERMFENAKGYNEDGSQLHQDAIVLQEEARRLAAQEKQKPDDAFRDEDGKLPLPEISYQGEIWKVGDWVHIRNPNDLQKPIVAQIYRMWKDSSGQDWVNACWYYRPEQTVHRHEKFFFENEVVKTGQYRDHRIEEIVDRCFVMFITRYPKGRPRGLDRSKSVYVCEARYNEEKYTFNKIKTWASCVPDEVREKDYEMDLYAVPRKLKKLPSPIKHLLREDAKDTDALPKPTWGSPNAPPMIGAVHRRPREANESPPPEPTPPPPPAPRPDAAIDHTRQRALEAGRPPQAGAYHHASAPVPSPSPSHPTYGQHFAPPRAMAPAHPQQAHLAPAVQAMPSPGHSIPPSPQYASHGYPAQQYAPSPTAAAHHAPQTPHIAPSYEHQRMAPSAVAMAPVRPAMTATPNAAPMPHAGSGANVYNPPRAPEVYTIAPNVNDAIPAEARELYDRDEHGRILFFTAPPVPRSGNGLAPEYAGLGHSTRHLSEFKQHAAERRRQRAERDERLAEEAKKKATAEALDKAQADEADRARGRQLFGQLVAELATGSELINASLDGWDRKALMEEETRKRRRGDAPDTDAALRGH